MTWEVSFCLVELIVFSRPCLFLSPWEIYLLSSLDGQNHVVPLQIAKPRFFMGRDKGEVCLGAKAGVFALLRFEIQDEEYEVLGCIGYSNLLFTTD